MARKKPTPKPKIQNWQRAMIFGAWSNTFGGNPNDHESLAILMDIVEVETGKRSISKLTETEADMVIDRMKVLNGGNELKVKKESLKKDSDKVVKIAFSSQKKFIAKLAKQIGIATPKVKTFDEVI